MWTFGIRGWLEVALRGGAVERDRHGGLDVDVAEIAEACRLEELEDERWQRTQHQLDVRGGRSTTGVDENGKPRRISIAYVGQIDDKGRRPVRQCSADRLAQGT